MLQAPIDFPSPCDGHPPQTDQHRLGTRHFLLALLVLTLGIPSPLTAQQGQEKIQQQLLELEKAVAQLRNAGMNVRTFESALKEARKFLKAGRGQSAQTLIQKTVQEVNQEDQKALGTLSVRGKKVLPGVDPKKIFPRIVFPIIAQTYKVPF